MALEFNLLTQDSSKPIYRKILIYGDTGSGKTKLAGSAQDVPEMANVLLSSIDGGANTLRSRGDIMVVTCRSTAQVEELLWLFIKKDPRVKEIHTLILDGLSELQKADLAAVAQTAAAKKESRNKDLNELQDYKVNKGTIERLIRMARDLSDITLIVTLWTKRTYPTDASGQQVTSVAPTKIEPDITAGVSKTIQGYFDDCYYIEKLKGSETRVLYTSETKNIVAKTRDAAVAAEMTTVDKAGVVQPYLVNPTFTDIYARYKKAYKVA
jgi:phage nucleotide-binding protein